MAFKIGMANVGDLVNLCPLSAWELTLTFVYWGWRISNANPGASCMWPRPLPMRPTGMNHCVLHAVAPLLVI